jgi:hypothetical protein
VEDINITTEAKTKWVGVLADLAHANYISALRLAAPDDIDNSALRFAAKLLLSSAGVFRSSGDRLSRDEDKEAVAVSERIRIKVEEAVKGKARRRGLS